MGNSCNTPQSTRSAAYNARLSRKNKIFNSLDKVEAAVGQLRKDASRLEEEKDALIAILDSFRDNENLSCLDENDREDILNYAETIYKRCITIDIKVRTNRNKFQEDALNEVNSMIDNLVIDLQSDPRSAKDKCMSYMDACVSFPNGLSDKKFESAILGCTLDDQKRVRKRLKGLFNYINCDFL